MKLTFVLLTACLLNASAKLASQNITFSGQNVPLKTAFASVEKQTGFLFFYAEPVLKDARPVTIKADGVPLEHFLLEIFKKQPFHFEIKDKNILISRAEPSDRQLLNRIHDLFADTLITVSGRIIDEKDKPVEGTAVTIKGTKRGVITDANGIFRINVKQADVLVVSSVGYKTKELKLDEKRFIEVKMTVDADELSNVEVTYSTGFQEISKGRTTGSYSHVNNELINRSISTNIIDRIKNVTTDFLFTPTGNNPIDNIKIRGESTIGASARPLVVLDNFEYEGDIQDINPNDIDHITILKDAAAASIWGAKSSNGVIVITTKKGKYNSGMRAGITSNFTFNRKQDLFAYPQASVADFVEIQEFLYNQGYYDNEINSPSLPALSPVVEALANRANGSISDQEAREIIEASKRYDLRSDLSKYVYQSGVNQQYAANFSGGGDFNKYFFSMGVDRVPGQMKRDNSVRHTFNLNNSFSFLKSRLEITTSLYYASWKEEQNGLDVLFNNNSSVYPYARLVNDDGSMAQLYQYRKSFIDTVGSGQLADWSYYPLKELNLNNNVLRKNNYLATLGLKLRVIDGLNIEVTYQHGRGNAEFDRLRAEESYYVRDYINRYSYIDPVSGILVSAIPKGDIYEYNNSVNKSKNFRSQLSYNRTFKGIHSISLLAGGAIQESGDKSRTAVYYGYNPENETSIPVDNITSFTHYISGYSMTIDNGLRSSFSNNRFLSGYFNGSYNLRNKYTLTASARKDGSNLFGLLANRKWTPLWSVGGKWDISKESFYKIHWLQNLSFRTSLGYTGNVDKNSAPYLIVFAGGLNRYNVPSQQIRSAPNPDLKWERVRIFNAGIDFSVKRILNGNIEYYSKLCHDLLGPLLLAPSTGVGSLTGNTAKLITKGMSLSLSSAILKSAFTWNVDFLFSYTTNKVLQYNLQTNDNADYVLYRYITVGNDVNSIYAYKWAGLDQTGAPRGYLDKNTSTSYADILFDDDISTVDKYASAVPRMFGSFRHSFSWKSFSLSANIIYKLRYFFRRPSVVYNSLPGGLAHADYAKRWKNPGDENITSIPSFVYPFDYNRDQFYQFSSVLVERGDHIRLQDIQLSYDLANSGSLSRIAKGIRLNIYVSNLGLIWKANKQGIDPESFTTSVLPVFAGGMQINF